LSDEDDVLRAPRDYEAEPPPRRKRPSFATFSWALGVPSALTLIIGGAVAAWPIVGYETPNGHAADITDVRQSVATATSFSAAIEERLSNDIQGVSDQLKEIQDEARCDKYRADARELRRQLQQRPNDVDLADEILRIEQRMGVNGLNCARFDV
jgi:uncharacterized protein (UPF0335 family)